MEIHLIKGRRANSYVIAEHKRLMVVDVAFLSDTEVARYLTAQMGRSLEEVDAILCTHGHGDHLGGVMALAEKCEAQIYVPPLTRTWRYQFRQSPSKLLRRWRQKQKSRHGEADQAGSEIAFCPSFKPLIHGATVPGFDNWLVIHTPGHTLDSCCYFHQPSSSLISGDTILGSGRTNRLLLPVIYRDRGQLQRSIQALNRLNPAAIYPGHGSSFKGKDLLVNLLQS